MTPLRHALCARLLMKACGGLENCVAIARASGLKIEKTQLGYYQDANRVQVPALAQYMRADLIDVFEEACGQPIYSRALQEERASAADHTLMGEAVAMVSAATAALAKISEAQADNIVTPDERKQIDQALLHLAQLVARTSAANHNGGQS